MIRRFPYEAAFLARTKLRYVNLPSILSDGKVDRSSRVPAFVAIYLGTETGLIFLEDGEPIAAGLVHRLGRGPAVLADVIARGHADEERAEVGYYRAAPGQLCAMWATLASPFQVEAEPDALASGERLLEWARERAIDGVLEILVGDAVHYIVMDEGLPEATYHAGRSPKDPAAVEDALLDRSPETRVCARAYPAVRTIPRQAGPALFALYERTAAAALDAGAEILGREAAVDGLEAARRRVLARHPLLDAFEVSAAGVRAHPCVAGSDGLTAAVAAWLFEAVSPAAHAAEQQPMELMRRVTEEQRYALEAQGFFGRLPWPLAF